MSRIVVNILLFLLPFVLFFAYAAWANRRRRTNGEDPLNTPWYWLIACGLLLAIIGFFVLRAFITDTPGCYIPARMVDGKMVKAEYVECDGSRPGAIPEPSAPSSDRPGLTQP
jgi:hypothetical protein